MVHELISRTEAIVLLAWIFHGCDGAGPLITVRGF